MLKIEKTVLPSPEQWEIIIEGMRNPKNSWDKMDSFGCKTSTDCHECGYYKQDPDFKCGDPISDTYLIGDNDHKLMMQLAKGGAVHAKYRRMIPVYLTINAPLYWWKEFDTYKVGTVANSCSTMHKIHSRDLTVDDFSHEHLGVFDTRLLKSVITLINDHRAEYIAHGMKDDWNSMIQLLPTSYNQKRTVMLNYEVLVNIYHSRKNHRLDEWHTFCDWIRQLPYSELITGGDADV